MKTAVWLKIKGKKQGLYFQAGPIKAYKVKPRVGVTEVALKVDLDIPDSVFNEPEYKVTVKIPDTATKMPTQVELAQNMEKTLSEQFGIRVKVSMDNGEANMKASESDQVNMDL